MWFVQPKDVNQRPPPRYKMMFSSWWFCAIKIPSLIFIGLCSGQLCYEVWTVQPANTKYSNQYLTPTSLMSMWRVQRPVHHDSCIMPCTSNCILCLTDTHKKTPPKIVNLARGRAGSGRHSPVTSNVGVLKSVNANLTLSIS